MMVSLNIMIHVAGLGLTAANRNWGAFCFAASSMLWMLHFHYG